MKVRANIAGSLEGQQHVTPAEQAAINAQNSRLWCNNGWAS